MTSAVQMDATTAVYVKYLQKNFSVLLVWKPPTKPKLGFLHSVFIKRLSPNHATEKHSEMFETFE